MGTMGRFAEWLCNAYADLPRSGSPVRFVDTDEASFRRVERDELVDEHAELPAIWHAGGRETHRLQDGLLSQLCHTAGDRTAATLLASSSYRAAAVYFVRFRDALLFPQWGIVMSPPGHIWRDSARTTRWSNPRLRGVPGIFRSGRGLCLRTASVRPQRTIEGIHLLAAHRFNWNYGHWHLDHLPAILAFEPELRAGRMRLLTPPLRAFQRQSLARLDLLHALDETGDETVLCRDLIFPSHLSAGGTRDPGSAVVESFARLRRAGRGQRASGAPTRIYVGRDDRPGLRVMKNQADLAAALARLGFVSIDPARHDYDEQIDLFSAARIIVGPHGSGLVNIGFAPPGCVVLTIVPQLHLHPWVFHLTALLRQKFIAIMAAVPDADRPRERVRDARRTDLRYAYEVDVDAVVRAVEGALHSLEGETPG